MKTSSLLESLERGTLTETKSKSSTSGPYGSECSYCAYICHYIPNTLTNKSSKRITYDVRLIEQNNSTIYRKVKNCCSIPQQTQYEVGAYIALGKCLPSTPSLLPNLYSIANKANKQFKRSTSQNKIASRKVRVPYHRDRATLNWVRSAIQSNR